MLDKYPLVQGLFLSGIGCFNAGGSGSGSSGFSITPGYVFSFDTKKYYGGAVSVTKYFINENSPNILSSFNTTIDAQLNFYPCFFKPVKQVNYIDNTAQKGIYFLFSTGVSVTS